MEALLPIFFGLTTLGTFLMMLKATYFNRSFTLFLTIWSLIIGFSAALDFFENTESLPPRFLFIIIPVTLWAIFYYRKLKNTELNTPWLLAVHVMRIPVEITLYYLFIENLIPKAMTFEGWNFDIISGITALLLLILMAKGGIEKLRKLIYFWNFFGLILLAFIVFTAILSAPTPLQQFNFDQPNVAVLQFPYIFLPGLIVPLVLLSHLLLIKNLNPKSPANP